MNKFNVGQRVQCQGQRGTVLGVDEGGVVRVCWDSGDTEPVASDRLLPVKRQTSQ